MFVAHFALRDSVKVHGVCGSGRVLRIGSEMAVYLFPFRFQELAVWARLYPLSGVGFHGRPVETFLQCRVYLCIARVAHLSVLPLDQFLRIYWGYHDLTFAFLIRVNEKIILWPSHHCFGLILICHFFLF